MSVLDEKFMEAKRWYYQGKSMGGRKMTNREIDKLVAEKIMGLTVVAFPSATPYLVDYGIGPLGEDGFLPHYSANMVDAWEVVDKLVELTPKQTDPYYGENAFHLCKTPTGWAAGYMYEIPWEGLDEHWAFSSADKAAMAICLAALKLKGIEVGGAS